MGHTLTHSVEQIGGGDGDDKKKKGKKKKVKGGGSSGGGGGGKKKGGGSGLANRTRHLKLVLRSLGLAPGKYKKLVGKAAKQGLGDGDFLTVLSRNKKFRMTFPGIKTLLATEGSVEGAIRTWRVYDVELRNALAQQGLSGTVQIDQTRIGALINGGVSVDEFLSRVKSIGRVQETAETKTAFNAYLTAIGRKALTDGDWFNFLANSASRDLYDLYEGFSISQSAGGAIAALDADEIARALGIGGELADLSQLPQIISGLKMEAGQELAAAGVAEKDLYLVAQREQLTGDLRLKADAATKAVEQILANRRARLATRPTPPPAFGGRPVTTGGRPPEESL